MPVLVTGGAGFIGSHLTEELLRKGASVTVAEDLSTGTLANLEAVRGQFAFRKIDMSSDDLQPLLSETAFAVVFHLAGNAEVQASVKDPRMDFRKNAVSTLNLLESIRQFSPQTAVLYASSATVYGEGRGRPIGEDDGTLPVSPYGLSKLFAERYVSLYTSVYGLNAGVLRLFSTYGPRHRKQVVYDLLCKLRHDSNELFLFGDGSQERDFNHVANVVEAFILVAERAPLSGEAYNVAGEETVSIQDLAERICRSLNVSPRFIFSGEKRRGETQSWVADTTRIRGLGYRPRLGLSEGLADTVTWFKTLPCL